MRGRVQALYAGTTNGWSGEGVGGKDVKDVKDVTDVGRLLRDV